MTDDEALMIVEQLLQPRRLNDLQQLVFCRSWRGQGYAEIAEDVGYDVGYIKDVGSQLWQLLSELLGEKVGKKNLQAALRRYQQEKPKPDGLSQPVGVNFATIAPDKLEFPSGSVPLHSPFYVERAPIEAQCWAEVSKPGSLIRIRAPQRTGKTSLMQRIVAYAKQTGFNTVTLNLQQADRRVFESLDRFLRWFCANISQQLQLLPQLDEYWDEDIGSKMSCTLYMQRYILKSVDTALVLALDEVNRLFEYPDLASDFLPLLRTWYEDASEYEVWQKLRLIVVHATEVYIPLNLNQSPFNVGLPIKLPEFTLAQVQALALSHGLEWAASEAGVQKLQALVDLIGGHPYLVRLALYHLGRQEVTLDQLLQEAATTSGIYADHLRQQLSHLQDHPELAIALRQVFTETTAHLEPITTYKLESLGLITLHGEQIKPSCKLYRKYFQEVLGFEF
ncbi:MAG: AAA-like domain-containing protein [Elainella sp. C42_A2020_010]|nr:AAA-like domain-containing protein [Elainella sp. C42_A2020_010]RNJ68490.1 MAG: hypothetical protein EDM05_15420 [Leptolyngbya sp. IPPAS B-1204]